MQPTPGMLSGGGIVIGTGVLLALLAFAVQLGGIKQLFKTFLEELQKTMQAHREHLPKEEAHHEKVEGLLTKIEENTSIPIPGPLIGDHSPMRGIETSPP